MIPVFVNMAEIITIRGGIDLAVLKFYFSEPPIEGRPPSNPFPVSTVVMPKAAAKLMLKNMNMFLAKQAENDSGMVCRTCAKMGKESCPVSGDAKFSMDWDGCSRWEEK